MTDVNKIRENKNFTRDPITGQSRIAKGSTIGRMKKKGFSLTDLNKIVMQYEKSHDLPILKHYIDQLYKDNNLLSKYIDKNVPTKTINELTGADGSPIRYIIEKTYEQPKEPNPENKPSQD